MLRKNKKQSRRRTSGRRTQRATNLMPISVMVMDHGRGGEVKQTIGTLVGTFASVSNAGVALNLTATIVEGVQMGQRIGRAIRLQSIGFEGMLVGGQANAVTDETRNAFRISIVEMTEGGGGGGASPTSANWNVNSLVDPRLVVGLKKIHYDKLFSLASPGRDATGYMPACKEVKGVADLHNMLITYYGAGANTETNTGILIWMISDSAAVAHPGFVSGAFILKYTDA